MMAFITSLPGTVAQGIIWGIMAIGVYITYRILDFADLTVDGSFATGGAAFAMCMIGGMNVYISMLIAFFAGCLGGLATGIFHTIFGIPPILAGILTQLALYSVNLNIMGQSNQALNANKYSFLVNMAKANGINTNVNKVIALVISNGIVALSGALLTQFQGFSDINMGRGAIVIGLAAVIIGEVIFGKLFKNFALKLIAAVFGGIVYYIVITIVISLGLPANDLKLFSALVVAVFLGIPYWKSKVIRKKIKAKDGVSNA